MLTSPRYLFTAPDGPSLLKNNLERLYPLLHGTGDTMKRFFCVPNAMREHLTNGGPDPEVRAYAPDPAFKKAFIDRMSRDGFEAPQCWYRATVFNKQHECDKELPEGRDKVEVPVLYLGGKDDAVCRPEVMYPAIEKGWLPKLEQKDLLDAAHWTPYEQPDQVAAYIGEWLGKKYAK